MKAPKTLISLLLIIFAGLLLLSFFKFKNGATSQIQPPSDKNSETHATSSAKKVGDEVLKNALNLYIQKKQQGTDFANGPCLGSIAPDWVLDIAHSPRQPVDDKPENECADFANGRAHHFIELDPEGKLIKIY